MALPDSPLTRGEQYLAKAAGQDVALPNVPLTRTEQYLAKIAGQDVSIPDAPLTRMEQYLAAIAENGGGSSITVEPLTVTENGTTTASEGRAYSPVTVDVPFNSVKVFDGTLSQPIPSNKIASVVQLISDGNGCAKIFFNFNGIDIETYIHASSGSYEYIGGCDLSSGSLSSASAYNISWNTSGACVMAKMLSQGSIVDVLAYAPGISTQVAVFATNGTVI